jgi:peptidoglycan/LPS O-acetylase OafA/YrhL
LSGLGDPESWRFRPDIEGLRAVAIIGVILFHAGIPGVPGGFLGVDVFFVLSGFLITGILLDEVRRTGTISLPAFWARRARRLLPAATLVSLITLVFLVRLDSPFAEQRYAGSAISFATYWSNILFWRRGADYFDQSVSTDPFLHTWSLAVEEQYYLLFAPAVLLVALVLRPSFARFRGRLLLLTVALSLVSLAGFLVFSATRPVFAFYGIPTRAWEFGAGGILALLPSASSRTGRKLDPAVALLALASVISAWFLANEQSVLSGMVTVLPVLGTAALIRVGSGGTGGVGRLLTAAPMRWLGRLSYSWYLWHWPLTVYWAKLVPGNQVSMSLGMPFVSLGLAQLTYVLVEQPARQAAWLRPARRGLVLALVLAAATTVTALGARRRSIERLRGPEYAYIVAARDARTRVYNDRCDRELTPAVAARCVYGAPGSDTTVVIFGDSHAALWFPALEPLAVQRGWRLVPLTRPGCTALAVQVWSSMPNRTPEVCDRWREAALERIRQLDPVLIVIGNYRFHSLLDPSGSGAHESASRRPDLWERGLRTTLARLPGGSAILLLEDSPIPPGDIPTCLIEHVNEVERCAFSRQAGKAPRISEVEQALSRSDPRVSYLDLTDHICDGPVCAAARGDTARYADDNHLSVDFAASLTRWLAPVVDSILAVRRGRGKG